MGFRFRKSINLGGGVRINVSKKGVGYSVGGKHFRYTKKAGGGTRSTVNLGHGVTYVKDSKKGKTGGNSKQVAQTVVNSAEKFVEYSVASNESYGWNKFGGYFLPVLAVPSIALGLLLSVLIFEGMTVGYFGLGIAAFGVLELLMAKKFRKKAKELKAQQIEE